jgi:aerobic-type carbon monoxide dehydrogenase small subunit (CoxS/CutS family)
MKEAIDIKFTVNNQDIEDTVDGEMTLLDYLRQKLRLTGTKKGCGQAQCGTCTVLLNGRPVKSCSLKLKNKKLQGAVIETIEGLAASDDPLHPIQEAFIRAGGLQCGFCTPGMIMSAKGLLSENPSPNRSEIRNHFAGRNLCRCTGYQKIIDAVEDAARVLRGEKSRLSDSPNDAPLRRQDAVVKVTGRLQYADDIVLEDMVYGKILFATKPHARLKRIDISAVEDMPGVIGVITAKDIPGSRKIGMIERDQPALVDVGDEIRSIADPIAAVFAESPAQARAALKALEVSYEVLPGVFSVAEATAPGAPRVYADKPGNIFYHGCLQRGETDQALKESEVVVSGHPGWHTDTWNRSPAWRAPTAKAVWRFTIPLKPFSTIKPKWPRSSTNPGTG